MLHAGDGGSRRRARRVATKWELQARVIGEREQADAAATRLEPVKAVDQARDERLDEREVTRIDAAGGVQHEDEVVVRLAFIDYNDRRRYAYKSVIIYFILFFHFIFFIVVLVVGHTRLYKTVQCKKTPIKRDEEHSLKMFCCFYPLGCYCHSNYFKPIREIHKAGKL